jgi:UDP-N-acetylmuramoylalanine--D-glutamate ligase
LHDPCQKVILNGENEITASYAQECERAVTIFSSKHSSYDSIVPPTKKNSCAIYIKDGKITYNDGEKETSVIEISQIKLPGMHNVENCMCAMAALWGIVECSVMREVANTFGGVEHRLEYVDNINGVDYYNSSIDSSPTRTAAALSAFAKKPLVICGGYDKNIPFEPLAKALCDRAKAVVLTGGTMEKIRDAIFACPSFGESGLFVLEERNFDKAFEKISSLAVCGDIVLLSPACASFDAFANFEVRGEHFKDLVHKLKNCAIPTTN